MRTTLILLTIILSSCGPKRSPTESGTTQDKLTVYLSQFKRLEIPITIKEGTIPSISTSNPILFDSPDFSDTLKYYLYARIIETPDYHGLIYSVPVDNSLPVLVTVDKKGKRIGDLQLLGRNGPSEPGYKVSEQARVEKNGLVVLTDSVSTWDIDGTGDRVPDTEKVVVTTAIYQILEDGRIEKKGK